MLFCYEKDLCRVIHKPMKQFANCLLILVIPFAVLSTAHARPWWQVMDIATADFPSRYGFHVSRKDAQDKDKYVITLDPAAAAVLVGARIIWPSKPGEDRKMDIIEVNGRKKIEFTVPPDFLQPSSFLQLDSGPIKNSGQAQMDDFNGYRLRLDNIPRDTKIFQPPPDYLRIQFPGYGGGPRQTYEAIGFASVTTLIETAECKVMWSLAEPPTTATKTVVGGLFVLTQKEGQWHATDAQRFEASGKDSAAQATPTSSGTAIPHLTVTLHQGGRGEAWEESASYMVKEGKLCLALPANKQPAEVAPPSGP